MPLTASRLRENIYKILDNILETGVPVEIERSGRVLKIICADKTPRSKLDSLEKHPGFLLCEPEDLVHMDWSEQWQP